MDTNLLTIAKRLQHIADLIMKKDGRLLPIMFAIPKVQNPETIYPLHLDMEDKEKAAADIGEAVFYHDAVITIMEAWIKEVGYENVDEIEDIKQNGVSSQPDKKEIAIMTVYQNNEETDFWKAPIQRNSEGNAWLEEWEHQNYHSPQGRFANPPARSAN